MSTAESKDVHVRDVRGFWEDHPVAAAAIPYPLGSLDYFRYYDSLREENESVPFSYELHEYKRFAGRNVLDVGSGNGYILSRYAAEGANVVGVDLTRTGIDLCRERFRHAGLQGQFLVGNAETLPFRDNSFDCVCSMGVLHHTPDTAGAVDEVFRVLQPGGRLIVMFYHRNSALYRFRFQLDRLIRGKSLQQSVNEVDGTGNPKGDVYTIAKLRRLLQRFDDVDTFVRLLDGSMVVPLVGKHLPRTLLRPFERRWGWFLYAKGFKPLK